MFLSVWPVSGDESCHYNEQLNNCWLIWDMQSPLFRQILFKAYQNKCLRHTCNLEEELILIAKRLLEQRRPPLFMTWFIIGFVNDPCPQNTLWSLRSPKDPASFLNHGAGVVIARVCITTTLIFIYICRNMNSEVYRHDRSYRLKLKKIPQNSWFILFKQQRYISKLVMNNS